jgi:hypothetical protein
MDGTGAIKWQQQQSVGEGKVLNQTRGPFRTGLQIIASMCNHDVPDM